MSYFCRRQGIPYVIEPMGMYRPIDRSFRMKRVWHRSLGDSYWSHAAQIVATSEMEATGIARRTASRAEKLVIRYNGIDRAAFAAPARARRLPRINGASLPTSLCSFFLAASFPAKERTF